MPWDRQFLSKEKWMNLIGLAAAAATLGGVSLGHVLVRRIEAQVVDLRLPILFFGMAGVALEVAASLVASRALAAALGILGVTLLWDALELRRQERRVQRGHAPAHPTNPRHAAILAAFPQATTIDWLHGPEQL
jgi:hypothetical protein